MRHFLSPIFNDIRHEFVAIIDVLFGLLGGGRRNKGFKRDHPRFRQIRFVFSNKAGDILVRWSPARQQLQMCPWPTLIAKQLDNDQFGSRYAPGNSILGIYSANKNTVLDVIVLVIKTVQPFSCQDFSSGKKPNHVKPRKKRKIQKHGPVKEETRSGRVSIRVWFICENPVGMMKYAGTVDKAW